MADPVRRVVFSCLCLVACPSVSPATVVDPVVLGCGSCEGIANDEHCLREQAACVGRHTALCAERCGDGEIQPDGSNGGPCWQDCMKMVPATP